jgi:N-acetylmuramic acid 6-phosphate etherase
LMALADCLELAGTFGIPREQTPMLFAGGAAALLAMTGGVEDDAAQAKIDVVKAGIGAGDVVLCLAASGSTPYTLSVATAARSAGARVIGLANTADAPLFDLSDISVLLETGPEVVAGSTRLGAATAQKAALNMISVLVGVRLGAVHDGQMVNLIADNIKLVDRAARIVARIAGTEEEAARVALHHTNGAVKPAILVARGQSADAALQALAASGGKLAPYLD